MRQKDLIKLCKIMGGMWKVHRKQFVVSDNTETRQQQIKWAGVGFRQTKIFVWRINSEAQVLLVAGDVQHVSGKKKEKEISGLLNMKTQLLVKMNRFQKSRTGNQRKYNYVFFLVLYYLFTDGRFSWFSISWFYSRPCTSMISKQDLKIWL